MKLVKSLVVVVLFLVATSLAAGKCYSDRECDGGVCRNNLCTTAGGKCYSDKECPGGTCRNNKCTSSR